jgi:hypothetical protein
MKTFKEGTIEVNEKAEEDDKRYRGWDWDRLEPEARRSWQERYPKTLWDDIKDAVRYAWENIKEAVRD